MKYPDLIRLATVSRDGYGDRTVTGFTEIPAAFIKRSSITRSNNSEGESSDAAIYLQPTNATVLSQKDDLEGMYLQVEPFSDSNWYRIASSNIAERKLLNNAIDNVYCRLDKVAGLAYVHIS